ncbi:Transcription factor RF2a [Zea mays]|uniref:Transcription factor RF2a n=1 Tax=Zea mays TaxID=4577 RepID=A0A3L6DBC8_MAIZE|nr:Transcription factor RF2a [Zea mays]
MEAFAAQHQGDVCMEAVGVDPAAQQGPRTAHRRSRSDVPSGYFGGEGHQLPPPKVEAGWGGHLHGGGGDDDLFNAYLNLEGLDSSDDRQQYYDGDSRGSSVRTNGADSSENDSEECAAAGPPVANHVRSLSMDSSLIGKLNFSAGAAAANGGVIPGPNRFSLEFGSGEFTPVEMNKIMADEKLAEMALADPKRAKRVLANRQSAARSKERKMRYIAELEQKVQILQTEATALSAHLTLLQRDSAGIATQNNELQFRLQAMAQQAQLRDALNEALTAEVQRLKLATAELGDSCSSNSLAQQMQIQLSAHDQTFELHQQQPMPIAFYQLRQAQ